METRPMRVIGCLVAALAGALPAAARAQTLQEVEARQQAVVEAWEKTPLTARRTVLVAAPATSYGVFEERKTNVFKPGESIYAYAEPIGYLWKPVGNGEYAYGIVGDFTIKSPQGKILAGQENFFRFDQTSRYRNQELMLNLTLGVSGAPPGDYILVYTLRDASSSKSMSFELPFKIVPGG